jgi:hypothetical protein
MTRSDGWNRPRKVVQDLIDSNARQTEEDFGKLHQHMKELRELIRNCRRRTRLSPDFPRLASPETKDKASEE